MKKLFIPSLFLLGFVFYFRYLFLITVMAEERTRGGFYEPLRLIGVKVDEGKIHPIIVPSRNEEFLKEKRIGPITFLIRPYFLEAYPLIKMKVAEKEIPFLYLHYIGVLGPIYIPKLYMKVFGTSIYSLRSILLVFFLLFIILHTSFAKKFNKENHLFISICLITFPIFGMFFMTPYMGNGAVIFILTLILISQVKKVFEKSSIDSLEGLIILIASGFIIHFHLLAGGVIIFSIFLAFLLTERRISFKIKTLPLIFGVLVFLILVLPYAMAPIGEIKDIILKGKASIHKFPFLLIHSILHYIFGIFAFPSFLDSFIGKEFGTKYLLFSIPSGVIITFGFIGLFISRKKGKFEKFIFFTSVFYLIITLFADVRSYHINYILPFVALFIPNGLKRFLSEKGIRRILLIGIFLNITQVEMLRKSMMNSSLSLSLHKGVADYLIKNKIRRIHNIAGMYDYVFISKERIEVIDFFPFIGHTRSKKKIFLSLLLSRGEVILLESYKRGSPTTGVSLEEVIEVAKEGGLRIRVLKRFPEEGKAELVLARVE